MNNKTISGFVFSISSFLIWGSLPLFWKLFSQVPALDVVIARMFFGSALMAFILLIWRSPQRYFLQLLPRHVLALFVCGSLLSINWMVYVWAVLNNRVLECSMGYYILPLVNVSFGAIFLGETLKRRHIIAILVALIGIGFMSKTVGGVPWISLAIAGSFGFYALIKKKMDLEPISAYAMESFTMLIWVAVAYVYNGWRPFEVSAESVSLSHWLWPLTGFASVLPLILYNVGVRNIPLGSAGMLQYIAPTLKLILAMLVFHEPITRMQVIGFGLIWLSVVVYLTPGRSIRLQTIKPSL